MNESVLYWLKYLILDSERKKTDKWINNIEHFIPLREEELIMSSIDLNNINIS